MKLLLYSFFVALAVPLFSFSLDPKNPTDACERFIHDDEKKVCLDKASSKDIDWYASSLCEKIDDDKVFLGCFDTIQKAQFDPKAVEHCEAISNNEDTNRFKCLEIVKNKSLGHCGSKKDIASFEACVKASNKRDIATDRKFFQK